MKAIMLIRTDRIEQNPLRMQEIATLNPPMNPTGSARG
jgi:hypothetical protein